MESFTRRELEKYVLLKYDPNAVEIIESAPLAAAYLFDKDRGRWQKLNCEGILFLYRKSYNPRFNLFLLNRLNQSHLYEPINCDTKLQIEDSFLLLKNDDDTIVALWIHDHEAYVNISEEIKTIIINTNLKTFCRAPCENNKHDEVSKMLCKTEEEYLKSSYSINHLRPTMKEESNVTSTSVVKFFNDVYKALQKNTVPAFRSVPVDSHFFSQPTPKMIRNPQYSLECIEKNQRYSYPTNEL